MFCPKCGTKTLDDATFCQKCGAKLIVGDTTQQAPTAMPAQLTQPQAPNVPSNMSKKKKLGKLPIILAVVGLAIAAILIAANSDNIQERGEQAMKDEEYISKATTSSEHTADAELPGWKVAYASKIQELSVGDSAPLFALIDLTGSDIPELVADYSGYSVSVFTWANESLVTLMDNPYGAGGNLGYEYLLGGNVIRNYNNDQAGAIVYESYMKVNDTYEVVDLNDETLSIRYYKDTNGNDQIDENEYIETPLYYYGEKEITEKEYTSYQISGNYEQLIGDKSAEEMLSQLNSGNVTSITASEVLYKGVPVSSFFDTLAIDVAYAVGLPEGADRDDDIRLYIIPERAEVESVEVWTPSALTVDGVALNKNRDGLIEVFGQPYEESGEQGNYSMTYNLPDYSLQFKLGGPDSEAWRISISPSAATQSVSSGILYNGEPIARLLGSTPEELNKIFGVPTGGTPVTGDYLFGEVEYYEYGEITFLLDYEGMVESITVVANAAEVNGTALSQNRTGIINLLGTPGYEGQEFHGEPIDYYLMEYTSYEEGRSISVEFPDAYSKANYVVIVRYFGGSSDEEYQEQSNNIDSSSPLTADGNTLSVGSLVYAKQNVFGVSVNYVRGYVTATDNAGSVSVQWDTLLENRLWAYDECAILSDSNSPSGYSYYSNASGKQIPLAGVKFNLSANELYSKIP